MDILKGLVASEHVRMLDSFLNGLIKLVVSRLEMPTGERPNRLVPEASLGRQMIVPRGVRQMIMEGIARPEVAGSYLLSRLGELAETCEGKLIYVVIDDLRWVPEEDRKALFWMIGQALASGLAGKVRFIMAWRTTQDELPDYARELLKHLPGACVELGHVDETFVAEMARRRYGLEVDEEAARWIAERGLRIPYFCALVLFYLRRELGGRRLSKEDLEGLPMPREYHELLDAHLKPVSERGHMWVLKCLSAIGRSPMQSDLLEHLAGKCYGKRWEELWDAIGWLKQEGYVRALEEDKRITYSLPEALWEHVYRHHMEPSERARLHAEIVRYLSRFPELDVDPVLVRQAHMHLRNAQMPDEEVLKVGLIIGLFLSGFLYEMGDSTRCVGVAKMAIELARELKRPLDELELMVYVARYADAVGLATEELRELVGRAEELVRYLEVRGTQEEADWARYYYCYLARMLAPRLRAEGEPEEGLKLLDRLRIGFADKISDERLRLDAMFGLLDVRAKLLIEMAWLRGPGSALETCEELVELTEKLGHHYDTPSEYHNAMAAVEDRLGEIYLSLGELEEAIEHYRALWEHSVIGGNDLGAADSMMNRALCLLLMGGEKRAILALVLLLKAKETFAKLGNYQGLSRSLRLACLAHLSLGAPRQDGKALSVALQAREVALKYLASSSPYDVAESLLVLAYACLVAERVPETLKAVEKPGDIPEHVHVAAQLSLDATRRFEECKDARAYIASLVHEIALCLASRLDVEKLLNSLMVARDKFDKRVPVLTRLLSECIEHLEARRCLDEEFLRRKFLRVLAY